MSDIQPTVQYRNIDGFPGYRVGDDGSVWSRWKQIGGRAKSILGEEWRRMKMSPSNTSGHLRVGLFREGKRYIKLVHRIVLEAFVGPCPPGMECCHGPDWNPANNHIGNLRWGTHRENIDDIGKMGRHAPRKGENSGVAKLSNEEVRKIRELASLGWTQTRIAMMFSVHQSTVSLIVNNKSRKHG